MSIVKSKAVSSSSVTVAALSALNIGAVESLPLAAVMTQGAENYSRPGWNAAAPTGLEALAANLEAVGQMNPVLYVERDGRRVLVAGFRRFAALSLLHARGKGTGTILARRVTTKDAETLPTAAVPALVNLVENEDAKVATGVMGRLAAYKALADAGLSAARIAALTGQSAVDYVADTLRLTSAECDPRLLIAAKAHDADGVGLRQGLRHIRVRELDARAAEAVAGHQHAGRAFRHVRFARHVDHHGACVGAEFAPVGGFPAQQVAHLLTRQRGQRVLRRDDERVDLDADRTRDGAVRAIAGVQRPGDDGERRRAVQHASHGVAVAVARGRQRRHRCEHVGAARRGRA
jgi:hypothetical protein